MSAEGTVMLAATMGGWAAIKHLNFTCKGCTSIVSMIRLAEPNTACKSAALARVLMMSAWDCASSASWSNCCNKKTQVAGSVRHLQSLQKMS